MKISGPSFFHFLADLTLLDPRRGLDGPDLTQWSRITACQPVASRPGPVRPTFRLEKKGATGKNTNFALESDNRFMGPSWVRAHGLILGVSYIVWVCAPRYRPLSFF